MTKSASFPFSIEPLLTSTPSAKAELSVHATNASFIDNLKSTQAKFITNGFVVNGITFQNKNMLKL